MAPMDYLLLIMYFVFLLGSFAAGWIAINLWTAESKKLFLQGVYIVIYVVVWFVAHFGLQQSYIETFLVPFLLLALGGFGGVMFVRNS